MKKTDVYVVVDTPKKAKKLKRLFDMFGQEAHPYIERPFRNNYLYFDSEGFYDTSIYKNGFYTENKTEVSIKELRNILAKENLRPGDVVALGYGKSVEYIGVFKAFNNGYFEVDRYLSLDSGSGILMNDSGYINNFIRYATEEEKALLEPKKYDKFDELKEAHRNGAVIQVKGRHTGIWHDNEQPTWKETHEYRVKPEEKPNLTESDIAIVERLHDALLDNHGYSLQSELLIDARMLANKIKSNIK